MKYEKSNCRYCIHAEAITVIGRVTCRSCNGLGYIMVAERPQTKSLINNKPNGTGARDGFNYGL